MKKLFSTIALVLLLASYSFASKPDTSEIRNSFTSNGTCFERVYAKVSFSAEKFGNAEEVKAESKFRQSLVAKYKKEGFVFLTITSNKNGLFLVFIKKAS